MKIVPGNESSQLSKVLEEMTWPLGLVPHRIVCPHTVKVERYVIGMPFWIEKMEVLLWMDVE